MLGLTTFPKFQNFGKLAISLSIVGAANVHGYTNTNNGGGIFHCIMSAGVVQIFQTFCTCLFTFVSTVIAGN
jgi:hypothetical protein